MAFAVFPWIIVVAVIAGVAAVSAMSAAANAEEAANTAKALEENAQGRWVVGLIVSAAVTGIGWYLQSKGYI